MLNNTSKLQWERLSHKNLDKQFVAEIIDGCGMSKYAADAILQTVKDVYKPFFEESPDLKPGQSQISIVSLRTPPNCPLQEAELVLVTLTLFSEPEDIMIKEKKGVTALRQHRLIRITNEAIQQGGVLTVEDLAHRIFNCGTRTICRDIKELKNLDIILPLRSTMKDMGRTLSHRKLIVERWLLGDEYSQIARKTNHAISSVHNYVGKFKRVVALHIQGIDVVNTAFLVRISSELVNEYVALWQNTKVIDARREELLKSFEKKQQS